MAVIVAILPHAEWGTPPPLRVDRQIHQVNQTYLKLLRQYPRAVPPRCQPADDTMKAMEIDTGDSRVEISRDIDTTSRPAL